MTQLSPLENTTDRVMTILSRNIILRQNSPSFPNHEAKDSVLLRKTEPGDAELGCS